MSVFYSPNVQYPSGDMDGPPIRLERMPQGYDPKFLGIHSHPEAESSSERTPSPAGVPHSIPLAADQLHTKTDLAHVPKANHLGYFSIVALVLNKTIGTGIYVSPRVVLAATQSKGISLILWLIGDLVAWGGLLMYLEYGFLWPVNGGEVYYVDAIFSKPMRLFTYIFSSMFVLVNGTQANCLTFGKEVILASLGPEAENVSQTYQKVFAIIVITFVCQLLAYSRDIYIKLSNLFCLTKIATFCTLFVFGMLALGGIRHHGPNTIDTAYGKDNLKNVFSQKSHDPYEYSLALLNVMRAYLGYENANLVMSEVRQGPPSDRMRYFRRAVKISVAFICFFYVMINVAFFAACTQEELIDAPETLELFFFKIFGVSESAHKAASVIMCISAFGAILSLTFANVRVKQEIGHMGILPYPEFWAGTSHRRTPAHALLLHWIFSVICIIITPLDNADGFLIMSTFYSYVHTYFSVLLGCALLAGPWLKSFRSKDNPYRKWKPESVTSGWWLVGPLVVIYILTNLMVLVFSWWPVDTSKDAPPGGKTLPWYTNPVAGISIIAFGALWWLWDLKILPASGYKWDVNSILVENPLSRSVVTRMNVKRELVPGSTAQALWDFCAPFLFWLKDMLVKPNPDETAQGTDQ